MQAKYLNWLSLAVLAGCVFLAMPALLVPLGLPPEGDAVAYRIPLIQWMLRHHAYPNWSWAFVDDYPLLAELMMLPLHAIFPGLARLVPLAGYLGCVFFAALIARELAKTVPGMEKADPEAAFVLWCAAWLVGFRPLGIQANLLMVDNVATCFALGSLYFVLRDLWKRAALMLALALASRYMIWGAAPVIFFALVWLRFRGRERLRPGMLLAFVLVSSVGALPFLIRNFFVNDGNPIFPLMARQWNGLDLGQYYFIYGRGKDLVSFLLFPFDLLYTNTFGKNLYDYTLGKLFYLQLAVCCALLAWKFREARQLLRATLREPKHQAVLLYVVLFTIIWFFGSQQLRFLVSALLLVNAWMFLWAYRFLPRALLAVVIFSTTLSVASIQKDSVLIALGKRPQAFAAHVERAERCLAQVPPDAVVGFRGAEALGFLDRDFVYANAYAVPLPPERMPRIDFLYSDEGVGEAEGYVPWPPENPCLLKKSE